MNVQDYLNRGWNVIPIVRGTKKPPKDFQLEKYFYEKFPENELQPFLNGNCNIGIVMGKTSNLAVIDVDDPEKTKDYLAQYPTDLIAKTPSGGVHLFYEYREGLPEILKISGGDFFSGKHYVVAAPSVFKEDGNVGYYEWIKFGNPSPLNNTLFQEKEFNRGKYSRQDILELINHAMLHGLRDGQWNDTILYGSMLLLGEGLSKEAVTELVMSWNHGKEPIPKKQVMGMINRAFEYSKNNVKKEETKSSKEHVVEFPILSYGEMNEKYSSYSTTWLVEDWILDSAVMICSALPEMFKTWLAIDLALSVVSGLKFLDTYEVPNTGNVLVIQQEDFGPRFLARFHAIERGKLSRAQIPVKIEEKEGNITYSTSYDISNKLFFHEQAELSLDNDLSLDKLEQRIIETSAKLCIIDPFYSLGRMDDYFASAAGKIRERIKEIRNRTGCAFLFIHHDRKGGTASDSSNRSSIWGSTFLNAAVEGSWKVYRNKGMSNTEILVVRRFKDMNASKPTRIKFNILLNAPHDEDAYWLEIEELDEGVRGEIKDYLRTAGPSKLSEIKKELSEEMSTTAFSNLLQKMVDEGELFQEGKRGVYSIAPDSE